MKIRVAFVMVLFTWRMSWEWTKVGVLSFRRHFPDSTLLAVDHNGYLAEEQDFVLSQGGHLLFHDGRTHAEGLDFAVQWCREHGFTHLVLLEPDCLISGKEWYKRILKAVLKNEGMAGINFDGSRCIHPCGTIWKLDAIPGSFEVVSKGEDILHERFSEVYDVRETTRWMLGSQICLDIFNFLVYYWDVGHRNWFLLAVEGKTANIDNPGDFRHFYEGRNRLPNELRDEDKELIRRELGDAISLFQAI